ncbi:MAG: TolC family protein [Polyangiales bacterium]
MDETMGINLKYRPGVAALAFAGALGWSVPGSALQPLDAFVASAHKTNPNLRASAALNEQRDAEADRATGALLPAIQAQGVYTRNQYQIEFPKGLFPTDGMLPTPDSATSGGTIKVLPYNQLDATFSLSVPLIDVGGWARRRAARATSEMASADLDNTRNEIARQVARSYFQLLAVEAVLGAAQRALQLSQQNAQLTLERRDAGTASELDVQRARGDVARAEQDVAASNLNVALTRRALETLSGLSPEPSAEFPADDLAAEQPLATWLGNAKETPAVKSARAARRAAELGKRAADAAWLPTVSGTVQERLTNAPALVLKNYYYQAQLNAVWRLDMTIPATVRATKAQADQALAKADATVRQADDAIFNDWHQVNASIERARSARTQVEAASAAAQLAHDRYEGGVATQLDVLQAQQDLFRADVGRIQADADVAYARAALRLDSGLSIGADSR